MDDQSFKIRFDAAVALHQTGQTQKALEDIKGFTSAVRDQPAQLLACRSETANLLYHVGAAKKAEGYLEKLSKNKACLCTLAIADPRPETHDS